MASRQIVISYDTEENGTAGTVQTNINTEITTNFMTPVGGVLSDGTKFIQAFAEINFNAVEYSGGGTYFRKVRAYKLLTAANTGDLLTSIDTELNNGYEPLGEILSYDHGTPGFAIAMVQH